MKKSFFMALLAGSLLMTSAFSMTACSDDSDPSINSAVTSFCKLRAKCQAEYTGTEYSDDDVVNCFAEKADELTDEIIDKCESKIVSYYSCLSDRTCDENFKKCSDKYEAFYKCTGLPQEVIHF